MTPVRINVQYLQLFWKTLRIVIRSCVTMRSACKYRSTSQEEPEFPQYYPEPGELASY